MTAFERAWDLLKEAEGDIPEENRNGDCYMEAGRWVCSNPGYSLAHAQVTGQGPIEGRQYGHAFTTYMGDLEGKVHEGEPVEGEHMEWAYDPSTDTRLPLALYSFFGRFNSDDIIRYNVDEMNKKMLEHNTWGPWDETALTWFHDAPREGGDV